MADVDFTPESGDIGFRPATGQGYTGTGQSGPGQSPNMSDRVAEQASQARQNVASGINRMGDKLDEVADNLSQRGDMGARAGSVVRGASDALDGSAEYIRTSSLGQMRDDLTNQIRAHPLLSMGAAIGAGFLLSKILD